MKHLGTIAIAALTLILTTASSASAQEPRERPSPEVDCDSICLVFPDQAPAECACAEGITIETSTGTSTGTPAGGGGLEVADPAAAAVIEKMQASYRDALAGTDNYTIIQASWSQGVMLGPPAPAYFEVVNVAGEPMPRQIPPDELARRQAKESGQPSPDQMASGISAMLRKLGEGVPEGYTPADEGEAKFIDLFNALAGTGFAQDAADELDKTMGEKLPETTDDDLYEQLMASGALGARLRLGISEPCDGAYYMAKTFEKFMDWSDNYIGLQCLLLTGTDEDEFAGFKLEAGGEDFRVRDVVVIVGGKVSSLLSADAVSCLGPDDCSSIAGLVREHVDVLPVPFYTLFEIWNPTLGTVRIEHAATAAEVADPKTRFIPRRTKSRLTGIQGVQEVTSRVLKIIRNEGPLDPARQARLLLEAMQDLENDLEAMQDD